MSCVDRWAERWTVLALLLLLSGVTCQEPTNQCSSKPCKNGGTCKDVAGSFYCECPPGFTRDDCSYEVDECSFNPCKHSSQCVDLVNGFRCECSLGYTGIACESNIDDCASSPCHHQATCVDLVNAFMCVCPPGFRGLQCDQDIPECQAKPCQNGGTCTEPAPGSFNCACPDGVQGDTCNVVTVATFTGSNALTFTSFKDISQSKGDSTGTPVKREDSRTEIQFTSTTTVLSGVMLFATGTSYLGQPQHIAVEFSQDSLLHMSANNGNQTVRKSLQMPASTSGLYNHVVHLHLDPLTARLTLDPSSCGRLTDRCHQAVVLFHSATIWNLDGEVNFGGVGKYTAYSRNQLTSDTCVIGCFGNLVVDGTGVNLALATSANSRDITSPTPGCKSHPPCPSDFCKNGGTCVDTWTEKTCTCAVGYSGSRCERLETAHFNPDSMLHIAGQWGISKLSLWVATASKSGLVLYTLTKDSMSISVDSGQVLLHLLLRDSGRTLVSKVGTGLDLMNWLKIVLKFTGSNYILEVQTDAGQVGSTTGSVGSSLVVTGPLFLGALHSHPAADKWRGVSSSLGATASIEGCIRDVVIDDSPLDLQINSATVLGNDPPPARPGCAKEESCLNSPCLNGGVCLPGWAGPTCQCGDDFTGQNCSEASASTFNGKSSQVHIRLDRSRQPFGDSGAFDFRTRQSSSTLVLLQFQEVSGQVGDFIEFRIYKDKLQVYSSFSKETHESLTNVADGQWHVLEWTRQGQVMVISLDGDFTDLKADFDPYLSSIGAIMDIYIGARPFFPGDSDDLVGYFKGCLRGISFNNNTLDLSNDPDKQAGSPLIIDSTDVIQGCRNPPVCDPNPCPANSFCVEDWNAFTCPCLEGWKGEKCAISVDDCSNNSCANNATCVDGHRSYTCACDENHTGSLCETDIEACFQNPCNVDSTVRCVSFNSTEFNCVCSPGYTGRKCETLVDNCAPSPCSNGASCTNKVNSFTCTCNEPFYGPVCQYEDYCASTPCLNNGKCLLEPVLNTTTSSMNTSPKFVCQCVSYFFGDRCQFFDFCRDHLCVHNSTCLLETDRYRCRCSEGFYGNYCEVPDYCASKPCVNGGTCRNSVDSHVCMCPFYFTGDNCETPVNQCQFNECFNGATCIFNHSVSAATSNPSTLLISPSPAVTSQESSLSSSSSFLPSMSSAENASYCLCVPGYTGDHCETDIDECRSSPCKNNGTCYDSRNDKSGKGFFVGYRCQCLAGFRGNDCEIDINECEPGPCLNNGSCTDLINVFKCACVEGFTGTRCETDTRGCASQPCQNGAKCQGQGDLYTCQCTPGFSGTVCETNVDDCVNQSCQNGGQCVDGVNGYTCDCQPGYSGGVCESVVDSCSSSPCFNQGRCSYKGLCTCRDVVISCGWSDEKCQRDRCSQRSNCSVWTSSFDCDCSDTGYTGALCAQDHNECKDTPTPCRNSGVCVNTVGDFMCNCKGTGYHGDTCDVDDDECKDQNPCFNQGTCVNTAGSFECACPPGWVGVRCGENRDDCLPSPCLNAGVCTDLVGGYMCNCSDTGYQGTNCTEEVDECVGNKCEHGGKCVDKVRGYTCVCAGTGHTGDFCEVPIVSCSEAPCLNKGVCSDIQNGVLCNCTGTGYHGNYCQLETDECTEVTHVCHEDSLCVNTVGGYTCNCGESRTGQFCETPLAVSSSSSLSNSVIIALVVIAFLLLLLIVVLVIWVVRSRRKQSGKYRPRAAEATAPAPAAPHVSQIPMGKIENRGERLV